MVRVKTSTADDSQQTPQYPRQQYNAERSQPGQQHRVVRQGVPRAFEPRQMTDVVDIPTRRLFTPDSRITETEPNIAARLPLSFMAVLSSSYPRGLSASRGDNSALVVIRRLEADNRGHRTPVELAVVLILA